jgi:hypothetical protein
MKSRVRYLLAAAVAALAATAWGQDEGTEAGATKTLDLGFFSQKDSDNSDASVSYTVPLTESLDFSTSTSLNNGLNAEDNRTSRGRNTNLSIAYDPPSPWRLNVSYANSYTLDHRPASETYDEFKTESSSNRVDSSLDYEISSDLKTDLSLAVEDSSQEILIEQAKTPPPTSGRSHTFGGGVDYNVTTATTLSVDYSGEIADQEIRVSRTRTFPPRPAKPANSRKLGNRLSGTIDTKKDLKENLSFSLSFSAQKSASRDRLQLSLDSDDVNGNALSEINYTPGAALSLTNTTSLNRQKTLYLHKSLYEKEFNDPLYDVERSEFQNNSNVRITPSEQSEMSIGFEYSESENTLRDEKGDLPPRQNEEAASACKVSQNLTLSSDVNLALGEDVTFHLSHYLKESKPHKIVFTAQDSVTRVDNLDGNIGFDWTEYLTVNVDTSMNITLYRYEDPFTAELEDLDDVNVKLGTTFIYDVTRDTTLEINTDIGKASRIYRAPSSPNGDSARINRHLSTTVRREFGRIFKPQLVLDVDYGREYYPRSPETNKRRLRYGFSPTAEIKTSDNLTFNLDFSYSTETSDAVASAYYTPKAEDWEIYRTLRGGVNITYVIYQGLTFAFRTSNSHTYYIRNRRRRSIEVPAESFFDLDAHLSYNF